MGNWIIVNMEGNVSKEEVNELIKYLKVDKSTYSSLAEEELGVYYLQVSSGICGLGEWINEDGSISAIGNVYERDCEPEDLFNEVKALCGKFKSLDLTIHVGGDYESISCVATIVGNSERVEKLPPQIAELGEISSDSMKDNFLKALGMKL